MVIFQNQQDMDDLVSTGIVDRDRSRLIRGSGVDPERFAPSAVTRDDGEIRVLFASRLIGEKGIHELVEAMARVCEEHPGAVLWLAGEPYAQNPTTLVERDLEKLARLPNVRLLGHRDDMESMLGQVDIVALPSWREGTPKILLEAAACGLPIVATDIPGCRGVVEHEVNGFLVPVKDSDALARAIGDLCGDAELRRSMGRRGREIILREFTSDIVVRRTLEVYDSLLREPAGQ